MTATTLNPTVIESPSDLNDACLALRLRVSAFGVSRKVSQENTRIGATACGISDDVYRAAVDKIDKKHPRYKKVTGLLSQIKTVWRDNTLPLPGEDGLRLIIKDRIDHVNERLTILREELRLAVQVLQEQWSFIRDQAKAKLGQEYDPNDYPESITSAFDVVWEFTSIEPPSYLMQVNPELYEQERQRVAAKFTTALAAAEASFAGQLKTMIDRLVERLQPGADGKAKTFRDATIENFSAFFATFKSMNIRSNKQLDALIREAEMLVDGVDPQDLRDASADYKSGFAKQLEQIGSKLDEQIITKPSRKITWDD